MSLYVALAEPMSSAAPYRITVKMIPQAIVGHILVGNVKTIYILKASKPDSPRGSGTGTRRVEGLGIGAFCLYSRMHPPCCVKGNA